MRHFNWFLAVLSSILFWAIINLIFVSQQQMTGHEKKSSVNRTRWKRYSQVHQSNYQIKIFSYQFARYNQMSPVIVPAEVIQVALEKADAPT